MRVTVSGSPMLKANRQHMCSAVILVRSQISRVLPCAPTGFSHAAVTCVTAHSSPFWKLDEVQGGTGYQLTPVLEVAGRIGGQLPPMRYCLAQESLQAPESSSLPTERKLGCYDSHERDHTRWLSHCAPRFLLLTAPLRKGVTTLESRCTRYTVAIG